MKRYVTEFIGTAFLSAIVAGSGIMGERLAGGNGAIALLANSLATGAGLYVLIQCLGSLSGAHFNPAVSLVEFLWGRLKKEDLVPYCFMQVLGAVVGIALSQFIFDLPLLQISENHRDGLRLAVSEGVATFGLVSIIALHGKKRVESAPGAIAAYIASAYWFTSSTSFANPALTVARSLTNTFCGIAPAGIAGFIAAQILGSVAAYLLVRTVETKQERV